MTNEDYMRQMVKHVENLKMSKEDREMYQSIFEQVYKEEGIQEGIGKGEQKKAVEVAKNFLNMGLTIEQIARGTGLAENEIRNLLAN